MRDGHPLEEPVLEKELERLEQSLRPRMSAYPVKEPAPGDSRRLVERLLAEIDPGEIASAPGRKEAEEHTAPGDGWTAPESGWTPPSLWRQVCLQVQTYGRGFWLVSLAVFAMLTLVGRLGLEGPAPQPANLFALAVPLYFLAGLVYTYTSWNREMRLVESVTPFPPVLLLLSRLLTVAAMNIILGLAGTAYLALTAKGLDPLLFLLQWLSVLLLTGGFLAYVLFYWGLWAAFGTSVAVWAAMITGDVWLAAAGEVLRGGVYTLAAAAGAGLFAAAWRKGRTAWRLREGEGR
ncbi:MAG: hypothetical protein QJR06_07395 [Alicyclobacillaceae bacterium]|nr:hypothetical protein [Alicyclobacillaceae bacterium]